MPKKKKNTFAADLLLLRVERGLRQYEVAIVLGVTGAMVCQWEKGYEIKDDDRRNEILAIVGAMPIVRGDGAAEGFDFARHARVLRLGRAIDDVVAAAEDVDEEWVGSWLESARGFRTKVEENVHRLVGKS